MNEEKPFDTLNKKLRQARNDRYWSIDEAAKRIGVSRTTYIRWEQGEQDPHDSTLTLACDAFKMSAEQLGFRKLINMALPSSMVRTSPVYLAGSESNTLAVDMFSTGILALALAQRQYGWTSDELQSRTAQEMRRFDMEHENENIPRRQVLSFLVGLPAAVLGLQASGKAVLQDEEALPLFVSSIPACWKLYFNGDLAEVERVLPSYLAHLTALAQRSSKLENTAWSLASQAYQLASLVVLEHEDFGASLNYCKQALLCSGFVNDPNILLGAYIRRANTLYYRRRYAQIVQTYQEAMPFTDQASPLMRGRIFSGLSSALSAVGQKQDALRYMGLAHDTFPDNPEDDPGFLYTHTSHYILFLNDATTNLDLGQPKKAWEAITRAAAYVPDTKSPRYIELLNHQALVAMAMNDLEQCCSHIERAITLGRSLGSDLYISDARNIITDMPDHWKSERKIKDVVELLNA